MGLFAVYRRLGAGFGNGANPAVALNTMAQTVVMDWRQAAVFDGRVFQIRAGSITAPLVGDEAIVDATAEMSIDGADGTTIIPVYTSVQIELQGGNALELAGKSVGAATSGGDNFDPLPLKLGGSASVSTARVDPAGGVTVTAELVTTTRAHWTMGAEFVQVDQDDPGIPVNPMVWEPAAAPVLVGPATFYIQVASATPGPGYFASADYVEIPTLMVNPS